LRRRPPQTLSRHCLAKYQAKPSTIASIIANDSASTVRVTMGVSRIRKSSIAASLWANPIRPAQQTQ